MGYPKDNPFYFLECERLSAEVMRQSKRLKSIALHEIVVHGHQEQHPRNHWKYSADQAQQDHQKPALRSSGQS